MKVPVAVAELPSWSLSFALAELACRNSPIQLLGLESNGGNGVIAKFAGQRAPLEEALEFYQSESKRRDLCCQTTMLTSSDPALESLLISPNAIHPLYNHREQFLPNDHNPSMKNSNEAIGIFETIGLTASLQASDAMLKAASVHLVGKEKIGAAYVTIVIRGEIAAVEAALAAGGEAVGDLGKVVASLAIARPHPDMLALLPG